MPKFELEFDPPIMNAAGTLGFSTDRHGPMDWGQLGAFVTNPISLASRTPAHGRRFTAYPGGFQLHTGHPNPGFSQTLRRYARNWERSQLPVIVHLLAQEPEELLNMVRRLENMVGVSGVEVGIDGDAQTELVAALAHAATGELPVILRLPMERALELANVAVQSGAMAVSLAAPRGVYPTHDGTLQQGRLYGPAILPLTLRTVQELVKLGIPTIAAGGIHSREQCDIMLSAGALAVQLDSALWRWAGYKVIH
jgi:dihydroorotate dehydrogenase (NAD+) catalytic subunit